MQEVFPPEVRKYLERLSGLEPVQKGVAQALGKKGIVLQPQQTGHAAPKVPIEGEVPCSRHPPLVAAYPTPPPRLSNHCSARVKLYK